MVPLLLPSVSVGALVAALLLSGITSALAACAPAHGYYGHRGPSYGYGHGHGYGHGYGRGYRYGYSRPYYRPHTYYSAPYYYGGGYGGYGYGGYGYGGYGYGGYGYGYPSSPYGYGYGYYPPPPPPRYCPPRPRAHVGFWFGF